MRVRAAHAFLTLALGALVVPLVVQAQDDEEERQAPPVMFLYDATHASVSPTPVRIPISLNWKFTADPQMTQAQHMVSSPVADADAVYFFMGRQMYSLDRVAGTLRWEKPLEFPDVVDSTPVINNGIAVVGCRDGRVYFVELGAKTGRIVSSLDLRAQHKSAAIPAPTTTTRMGGFGATGATTSAAIPTSYRVQSSGVYSNGMVFIGGDDGWIYGIDLQTRTKAWEFHTKGQIKSSPACWNGGVYVASQDGFLYGLSEQTGRLRWRTRLDMKDVLVSPVIARSKILIAAGRYLYACDAGGNGYVRWRFEAKGDIVGSPAVTGDRVLFGDTEGKFYAVDLGADGDIGYWDSMSPFLLWQIPAEPEEGQTVAVSTERVPVSNLVQSVRSAPTVLGTTVLFRSGPKRLVGLSVQDGKLVWQYSLSDAAGALQQPPTRAQLTGLTGGLNAGFGGRMGGNAGAGRTTGRNRAGGGFGNVGGTGTDTIPEEDMPPALAFETHVFASPTVAGTDVYVVGDDAALYAFSQVAEDGVQPEFGGPEMEVPARDEGRSIQRLRALKGDIPGSDVLKVRGAGPVYIRVKVADEGTGVNPQTLAVTQEKGGAGIQWAPAFDADGGYAWAIYEDAAGGVTSNLPDGEYTVAFAINDYAGNQTKLKVAFQIDNSLAAPAASRSGGGRGGRGGRGGQGGPGGGMMPGGGGMPGGAGMAPGMGGGMMPGMMPGMGGGGMGPGAPGGMGGGMMPGMMPGMGGGGMMPGMMPGAGGGGMMPGMMPGAGGGGMMPGMMPGMGGGAMPGMMPGAGGGGQ